jgi:hypothetical protein
LTTCPGGLCTDTSSDPANCGTCGHTCRSDQICSGGNCVCPDNGVECTPGTCTDINNDKNNCGACGHTCDPGETCKGGSCVSGVDV